MLGKGDATRALRVEIHLFESQRIFHDTFVLVDYEKGVVHILSRNGETHLATFPLISTAIIWNDMTELS
jgi:hypothetical protein